MMKNQRRHYKNFQQYHKNEFERKLLIIKLLIPSTEMCLLSNNIYDYVNVSQGKITVPNMDDGEEGALTDVSHDFKGSFRLIFHLLSDPPYFLLSFIPLFSVHSLLFHLKLHFYTLR